ncbi:O-acetyltransferase OatA [Thalassocella blandensis]|nr:O-acetyltransferase OatA [Thalassocella blandensis]
MTSLRSEPPNTFNPSYKDSKQHFLILDALRGIAAIIVVIFHVFEAHATGPYDLFIAHGYLAVDFFFVLSGFVIGYAYDERWSHMSYTDFCKRRLIRLHPLIIVGSVFGALLYYFQAGDLFPLIADTPLIALLAVMLLGMTLLPLPPSLDIRGWVEMHPLNGPAWTLFFEYLANILYALLFRRFSNAALALLVSVFAAITLHHGLTSSNGDFVGGWSLHPEQLKIGFIRLLYPFFAGLLLSRVIRYIHIQHAFTLCSLVLIGVLAWPRIGDASQVWLNGAYEAFCIIVVFPLIVFVGACGKLSQPWAIKVCTFLGGISYPVYIVHYPLIYTYFHYVRSQQLSLDQAMPIALGVISVSLVLAYASLKLYDVPLRRYLAKRFL